MISKCFEEFYSELNSMSTQDIKHVLEEDLKNLKKCTASFEVRDIVERQQTEIESLKIENQSLRGAANSYKFHYNEARAEAIKEFADRLKKESFEDAEYYDNLVFVTDIDDILKEMVGDTE